MLNEMDKKSGNPIHGQDAVWWVRGSWHGSLPKLYVLFSDVGQNIQHVLDQAMLESKAGALGMDNTKCWGMSRGHGVDGNAILAYRPVALYPTQEESENAAEG